MQLHRTSKGLFRLALLVGAAVASAGMADSTAHAQSGSKPAPFRQPTRTAQAPNNARPAVATPSANQSANQSKAGRTPPTTPVQAPTSAPVPAPPTAATQGAPAARGGTSLPQGKPAEGQERFTLLHRLQPGEVLRTRTTHLANTFTRIQGTEDVSESRTVSEKVWEVHSVSPEGWMTFQYRIEAVSMSQKSGDKPELTYDSRTDKEAPPIFAHVAKTITEPVATVTIDSSGTVIERDNQSKTPPLGMGEIAVPLPKERVALGDSWSIPREARVKLENGTQKTIKLREQYTLEKVSAGVATIRVETQPLTPVSDPAVDAQLMQQMSRGVIKFDLDRGRLISKELSWDDEVVGFRGAETALRYTGRFTEEPMDTSAQSASKPATAPKTTR